MMLETAEEKRNRLISDAVTAYMKDDPDWLAEIRKNIESLILANPGKRDRVILKWVLSAEKCGAKVVKDQILTEYDQRGSTS